jgi:plastocyanin
MRNHLWSVLAAAIGVAGGFSAATMVLAQGAANEVVVVQRDIDFDNKAPTIRVGGQIVFVNEDRFGHNVFSETPGGEFDIGRQAPNTRIGVPFRRAGTFTVNCRIHPRMEMTVNVVQ